MGPSWQWPVGNRGNGARRTKAPLVPLMMQVQHWEVSGARGQRWSQQFKSVFCGNESQMIATVIFVGYAHSYSLLLVWFISTNTPTERSRARRTASAGAIRQCLKYQEYSGCWWIPLTNNWVGGAKMWSFITLFSIDCQLFRWFLLPNFSTLSWSGLLMRHGIHDKL